jgi:hypothetical protein
VDKIRSPWEFSGVLVKFKLEVGVTDIELLAYQARLRLGVSGTGFVVLLALPTHTIV